jgi:hypothetical protein
VVRTLFIGLERDFQDLLIHTVDEPDIKKIDNIKAKHQLPKILQVPRLSKQIGMFETQTPFATN